MGDAKRHATVTWRMSVAAVKRQTILMREDSGDGHSKSADNKRNLLAAASAKFERVLHPAFEEDEWKLIGVGGLLGLAVGVFQLAFVFGDMV